LKYLKLVRAPFGKATGLKYLLHAGSDRVGVLDIREAIHEGQTPGNSGSQMNSEACCR
jgi:hypothetical protein